MATAPSDTILASTLTASRPWTWPLSPPPRLLLAPAALAAPAAPPAAQSPARELLSPPPLPLLQARSYCVAATPQAACPQTPDPEPHPHPTSHIPPWLSARHHLSIHPRLSSQFPPRQTSHNPNTPALARSACVNNVARHCAAPPSLPACHPSCRRKETILCHRTLRRTPPSTKFAPLRPSTHPTLPSPAHLNHPAASPLCSSLVVLAPAPC